MEEIEKLKERVLFLEEIIKKYVLTGHNQFEATFKDWKNKQGLFRPNQL